MSFLQQLRERNPGVRATLKKSVKRVQRQTLEQARDSIVGNLQACYAYFKDRTLPKPSLCWKTYDFGHTFGIKYGNTYLQNVFEQDTGGMTFFEELNDEDMPSVFEHAIAIVKAGECDAAIQQVMAANRARQAPKH